jgi:hypothetical protein
MPTSHQVQQGECLVSIAESYGFFWETLWNLPENRTIRETRRDPTVLLAGDVVTIPERTIKDYVRPTGARHTFRVKNIPARLNVRLHDEGGRPRSGLAYVLTIDGVETTGTTDGDGAVHAPVPPTARAGTLRLVALGELVDVNGLSALRTVGGDLELIDCDAVANTTGLNALGSVRGDLRLRRLNSVTNQARAGGTQELTFNALVEVGGLEITGMNDIEDLAGLESLDRIGFDAADNLIGGGALVLDGNPKLETLFGLQGLTKIGRKISILNNPELTKFGFDDDNQDREQDIDNANGINNEANDPDAVFESGFVETFKVVGAPVQDGVVLIGGQTGVIELRNNPRLDEGDFINNVVDNLDNFEGFTFFCGNDGSADDDDDDPRTFAQATCPQEGDGLIDLVGGEGEGE